MQTVFLYFYSLIFVQHLVNLQFRPEGIGVKIAIKERSDDCNFHDKRNCQVELVVG